VLLSTFVETILGTNRKDTSSAQNFLDEQIALYAEKQRSAEEKLKLFKQKYAGTMLTDGSSFYGRLNILESTIQDTQLNLREAESRSLSLRSKLAALVNEASEISTPQMFPPGPLENRILNLETKLDDLLLSYTEQHPDVISTRRVLEQLNQQKNEKTESKVLRSDLYNSPLHQEMNILISESEAELSALRARLTEYQSRREVMEEKVTILPEIEADLVNLNRDYEINRQLYQDLVMRRESSQLSYLAEQTGEEMQFRVLEPPLVPISPASPNRIRLESMVLLAAIGLGLGIAVLHEQINRTFFTGHQLKNTFNLPILGVVTIFLTKQEIARRRMGIIVFCIVAFIWLGAYAGLVASHLLNIDLIKSIS
jgi:polysaccharide chain length determinant protein (PEP-CTERM system associated)